MVHHFCVGLINQFGKSFKPNHYKFYQFHDVSNHFSTNLELVSLQVSTQDMIYSCILQA